MNFEVSDPIPFSVDEAFYLIRDHMPDLVPYMKDTESIEVVERSEAGDEVKIVNRWQAAAGDQIPKALQKLIKPEYLSWIDHATWSTEKQQADWELEALGSSRLFSCSGTTAIQAHQDPQKANLVITVSFEIHPENIPGIPKFLAKKIAGQVENFIGDVLKTNMRQLSQSMSQYAQDQKK